MNKQKLQEEVAVRGSSHIKPNFHLPIDKPNFNEFMDIRDKVDSKRHNTSLTNINSSFYDYNCKEEWLVASTNSDNDIEIRVHTQNPDEVTDEVEDVIDSSNDTVSEAGTYTIEREQPCPEEEEARKKLENIIGFMKTNQEKGIAQDKDEDNAYKVMQHICSQLHVIHTIYINSFYLIIFLFEMYRVVCIVIIPTGLMSGLHKLLNTTMKVK